MNGVVNSFVRVIEALEIATEALGTELEALKIENAALKRALNTVFERLQDAEADAARAHMYASDLEAICDDNEVCQWCGLQKS